MVQSSASEAYAKATATFIESLSVGVSLPGVVSLRQSQVVILDDDGQTDSRLASRVNNEQRPDLILAVGSRALIAVRDLGRPVVYLMVPVPDSIVGERRQVVGVKMIVDPQVLFSSLRTWMPGRTRIGLCFNPATSRELNDQAQAAAQAVGLSFVGLPASDDRQAARIIADRAADCDLIVLTPDPSILSPTLIDAVALLSLEKKVPIVAFAPKYLTEGAAMAIFSTPEQMGAQAADLAKRLLSPSGPRPSSEYAKEVTVQTNNHIMQALGIGAVDTGKKTP